MSKVDQIIKKCDNKEELNQACKVISAFFLATSSTLSTSKRKFWLNENVGSIIREILGAFENNEKAFPATLSGYVDNNGAHLNVFSKAIAQANLYKAFEKIKEANEAFVPQEKTDGTIQKKQKSGLDFNSVELNNINDGIIVLDFPFNVENNPFVVEL